MPSISEGGGEIAEVYFEDFVFGVEFVLNGGEGTEEEVTGVGHDGGATGVDAVGSTDIWDTGRESNVVTRTERLRRVSYGLA